jgi:hypothetical protein
LLLCDIIKSKVVLKKEHFMTKRDIAGYLDIDTKTLYNWEKDKPNLYKTVMKGLAYDEIVELNKKTYEKAKEMSEKFEK